MKQRLLTAVLSTGLLLGSVTPGVAATYHHRHHYRTRTQYIRHRRHMKTAKRVGIGAAGGAAIGALAGGGKGAGIGAIAGAGAGALYDSHEKHRGHN
jgi:outer membrane lipoprotein SlyB